MSKSRLPLIYIALLVIMGGVLYIYRFVHASQIGVRVDDAVYIVTGESFAQGMLNRLINYPNAPVQDIYSLGYSLLVIAPLYKLFGPNYDLMRLSSLVLGIFNIVLVFWYLRDKLKLYERLVVALLFALNDFVAGSAGMVMGENAFLFFLLIYLILFENSLEKPAPNLFLVGAIISLGAAFWVRYWAFAFVIAGFFFLISKRKTHFIMIYSIIFVLLVLPLVFLYFKSGSEVLTNTPSGFLNFGELIQNPVRHLEISSVNYWHAIPYTMIPLFGPTSSSRMVGLRLGWIIEIFTAFVFVLLGIGFFQLKKKNAFITILVILYYVMVFVLGIHFVDSNASFDEIRYTSVMLPFLYLALWLGISSFLDYLLKNHSKAAIILKTVIGISMVFILLARNVRDVQVGFAAPDLSLGSEWIKSNTSTKDIIMTFDPVSRFLYLQRKTIDIGSYNDISGFVRYVTTSRANYLLVVPSLLVNESPGTGVSITPIVNSKSELTKLEQDIILPATQQYPYVFDLRYHDEAKKIWIYEITP